jgi:hypothetical protein
MLSTNTSNHNVPENCIEASINKILHKSSDLNTWTSKFVVTHGDKSIDVSLAAKGHISSFPSGISPTQKNEYSWTKYCFDENLFLVLMLRNHCAKCSNLPTALMDASWWLIV